MYGVVLWSDAGKDQALIWCEDHGKLALFDGRISGSGQPLTIEAGDLVTVDIEETREFRRAYNLAVVASNEYPQIADTLRQSQSSAPPRTTKADKPLNVLPFGRERLTATDVRSEPPHSRLRKRN